MEDLVLSCLESRVEGNRNLYARFLVGPFLKGDALTVATALRRALLSSVESVGITALYIQGITHEFSTIAGVRESVLELSLNFQAIVLSYDKTFFQKKNCFNDIQIGYLQVQGPKIVYANDLKLPLGIKLVDPTQYIATISKEGSIILKFVIGKKNNFLRAFNLSKEQSIDDLRSLLTYARTPTVLQRCEYGMRSSLPIRSTAVHVRGRQANCPSFVSHSNTYGVRKYKATFCSTKSLCLTNTVGVTTGCVVPYRDPLQIGDLYGKKGARSGPYKSWFCRTQRVLDPRRGSGSNTVDLTTGQSKQSKREIRAITPFGGLRQKVKNQYKTKKLAVSLYDQSDKTISGKKIETITTLNRSTFVQRKIIEESFPLKIKKPPKKFFLKNLEKQLNSISRLKQKESGKEALSFYTKKSPLLLSNKKLTGTSLQRQSISFPILSPLFCGAKSLSPYSRTYKSWFSPKGTKSTNPAHVRVRASLRMPHRGKEILFHKTSICKGFPLLSRTQRVLDPLHPLGAGKPKVCGSNTLWVMPYGQRERRGAGFKARDPLPLLSPKVQPLVCGSKGCPVTNRRFVLARTQRVKGHERRGKPKVCGQQDQMPLDPLYPLGAGKPIELSKKNILKAKKGSFYKNCLTINCFWTKAWLPNFGRKGKALFLFPSLHQNFISSVFSTAYASRDSYSCKGNQNKGTIKTCFSRAKNELLDKETTKFRSKVFFKNNLKKKVFLPIAGAPVKQPQLNLFNGNKAVTFLNKHKVFKSNICLRNIIPLDLTLTPVLKVNFVTEIDDEVLYLRQKIRERIVLEIWTNGSIHPRQALHDAALSLTDMFASFRSVYQVKSSFLPVSNSKS